MADSRRFVVKLSSNKSTKSTCVAFEVYMCLGYSPDGIVLVSGYYVTCLDLLFYI